MSLKENYIKLTKKFGGTHTLIGKGLTTAHVNSIMRGSDITVSKAYEVAQVLGVSVETLLTGKDIEKHAEEYLSPEEARYVNKLKEIFRGGDELKKSTIKHMLDYVHRDKWEDDGGKKAAQEKKAVLKKRKAI